MSTTSNTTPKSASVFFARGVIARLSLWSTLRIAVQQNWGGPESAEKSRWLASTIVDSFEEVNPTPDAVYVEEMLLQVMDDEFEVVVEDGSSEAVARDIVRLWAETQVGQTDLVLQFEEQADKVKGKMPQYEMGAGSDDEWEDDSDNSDREDEAPQLLDHLERSSKPEPEIDEDGFTIVRKGRR